MNSTDTLKKLASLSPPTGTGSNSRNNKKRNPSISDQGDMQTWFEKWAEQYCNEDFESCETRYNGDIMYRLTDGCVFDRNHKEAAIIIKPDGKLCYHCFHDSCINFHWQDFRDIYDPEQSRHNTAWQGRKVIDNAQ